MPDSVPNRFLSRPLLDRALTLASLVLAVVHTWAGRYSINPDGISYLDVGSSFVRHDWANALNAWWSPLYPWSLGIIVSALRPSPKWEFPLVQAFQLRALFRCAVCFPIFPRFSIEVLSSKRRDGINRDIAAGLDPDPYWICNVLVGVVGDGDHLQCFARHGRIGVRLPGSRATP